MFRKVLLVIVVFLSLLAFNDLAFSSVVGTWDVYGTVTARVTIRGQSGTGHEEFWDEFTFDADGEFHMIDLDGTWTQTKGNFLVFIASEDIEDYFEDYFYYYFGWDVGLTVTKNVFKGKESKLGDAISGKWNLKMTAYFYDYGLSGKISVVTVFFGTRASPFAEEGELLLPHSSLLDVLARKIRERITNEITWTNIQ